MRVALPALLFLSLSACSKAAPPPEVTASASEPIVGGTQDNGNDATVFIQFGNSGGCTGTIIQKDLAAQVAYVLTAAHCFGSGQPQFVLQGDTINGFNVTQYNVVASQVHPSYDPNNSLFDFGILKVTGAGNGTPVVPVPTPAQDTIGGGDQVELSGYGVTQAGGQASAQRMHVNVTLAGCANFGFGNNADNFFICYDQGNGSGTGVGACNGDSGGPAYAMIGNTKYVVGVTSFGDQNCNDFGVSGRASVATDFINQFITGQGGGQLNCDQCFGAATSGMGACVGAVQACFNNASCSALNSCLGNCASGDSACQQACVNANQAGLPLFQAIFTCVCDSGCAVECSSDPMCNGPACGFTASPSCQGCFEGSCCNQASACADDPTCTTCVTSQNPPASCANNALVQGFYGCLEDNCAAECGIQTGGGGSGGSGSGGSGTGGSGTGASGPGGSGSGASGPGGSGSGAGGSGAGGSGSGANNGTGNDGTQNNGSCSCTLASDGSSDGAWAGLGLLGLLALRARRKRAA